jgi:hypothetical protein
MYCETVCHFGSKERLVNSVYCATEHIICNLVYFHNLFGLGKQPAKRIGTSLDYYV